MKRLFLIPTLFGLASIAHAGNVQTLVTKTFTIDITTHCEEGEVTCSKVDYVGTRNGKPSDRIKLKGRTLTLANGQGRFIGYEFKNGAYLYKVLEEGQLQIFKGGKLLQRETGVWK
ncbi:hypothetical protein PQR63_06320 [Herbaspirillum rhizosphaerae]|uniref:MORN repeat protein n=1 Tax=Herbaspirillum rhizosphaerae TaxID=346179 RepID=A0ABW8Z4Z7_9BURK